MTVIRCPKCREIAFIQIPMGRICSKCGYEMLVPSNKEGWPSENPYSKKRGKKCCNCGENTVFNNMCRSCGAIYREKTGGFPIAVI